LIILNFRGIWSPMPTPFGARSELDLDRSRELVDYLVDGGVDGLFPLGTTGEFALMSREERRKIVDTVVDQTNDRVPVLCGVSDPSLANVRAFALDAKDSGCDGVVATPPYYFKATGAEECYSYFKTVAESTDLPLFVYNIPEWTGTLVPVEAVARLADEDLIAGMKYTEYNLLNLLMYIRAAGERIPIFTGSDAMAYTNLEFGGAGAVVAVSNVAPRETSSIFDLHSRGDHQGARQAQMKLLPAIEAIGMGSFPSGLKEAMKLVGMPVGGVREPLGPLSEEQRMAVKRLLAEAGLQTLKKEGES